MKGDHIWSDLRPGAVTSTAPSDDLGSLNHSLGETQSEPNIDDSLLGELSRIFRPDF